MLGREGGQSVKKNDGVKDEQTVKKQISWYENVKKNVEPEKKDLKVNWRL